MCLDSVKDELLFDMLVSAGCLNQCLDPLLSDTGGTRMCLCANELTLSASLPQIHWWQHQVACLDSLMTKEESVHDV